MGLATIDPYSHKVQTKLYKIPKFGVNRPKSKQLGYSRLKMSKFTKKYMVIFKAITLQKCSVAR